MYSTTQFENKKYAVNIMLRLDLPYVLYTYEYIRQSFYKILSWVNNEYLR